MKTAIVVTWACVTLLMFGVLVSHSKPVSPPKTPPEWTQTFCLDWDANQWADCDEAVPVSTEQAPIVWIANRSLPAGVTNELGLELYCLYHMEAAMREHDAIDAADLALRNEYSITPGWLHDVTPGRGSTTCLALGGNYHCGDELNWPRQISKESIAAQEKQIEEDKQLLVKREAYQAEKAEKESALQWRRAAFVKLWAEAKRECWRQP